MSNVMKVVTGILIVFMFAVGMEFLGIGWTRYFGVKHRDARREVFEQTQSYTHGKIQELSKMYLEYQQADSQGDKDIISNVIKVQFAGFDEDNINSDVLRRFLVNVRGY